MRRIGWTAVAVTLLAVALWLGNSGHVAGSIASAFVGFAAGWVFATRVLP